MGIEIDKLKRLLSERILILDGAMGTMLQGLKLSDADFHGERFKGHPKPTTANYDVILGAPNDADNFEEYLAGIIAAKVDKK